MITGMGFLGLMFLACFTTKLKILNITSTSYESFAQHWHSHMTRTPPKKKMNCTNRESFSESSISYSQPMTAELGPHIIRDVLWRNGRGAFYALCSHAKFHLTCINESVPPKIIYFLEGTCVCY